MRSAEVAKMRALIVLPDRHRFLLLVGAPPAILLVAHLLPTSGPGLALRLAAAAACILLVPGAVILRAFASPAAPALAFAASFAFSLLVVALAVGFVFVVGASILVAAGVILVVSTLALVPAVLRATPSVPAPGDAVNLGERRTVSLVLAAGIAYAGYVWWVAGPLNTGAYFHLGRARKLFEFETLSTLSTVNEFENGGLHPGYAFPLWHAVDALIARLAGVDVTEVVIYLPACLVPLAFVLGYAAGSALFSSRVGGLCLVATQAALFGFSGFIRADGNPPGSGLYENLSLPQAATHMLLATAVLALAFSYAQAGGGLLLVAVGAAALALAAVHVTYVPYIALLLAGFLAARALLVRGWEPLLTRCGLALAVVLVPLGLLLILLIPVGNESYGVDPSEARRAAELAHYGDAFTTLGDWIGMSPGAIARSGPLIVAGLLAIPLAGFAARRLWAAFVLGGSIAVLCVVLVPPLFTALADAVSLSQARRLPQFLPVAFALAGACLVLGRLKALGVCVAAGASLLLVALYPAESYPRAEGGPGWAVWVAVACGLLAIAAGMRLRTRGPSPSFWATVAALAFVLPQAFAGALATTPTVTLSAPPDEVIAAVRAHTAPGDVLFSDAATAYTIAAFAPVYINAAPATHVTETVKNQPRARAAATTRFFSNPSLSDSERRAILDRWKADWVLVDKNRGHPQAFLQQLPAVFEDGQYALYRVVNDKRP